MIDKTDQTRSDLIEAVHLMRHDFGSLWTPVYECGCESWVDTMLGNYDDIVNERESTSGITSHPHGLCRRCGKQEQHPNHDHPTMGHGFAP